MDVRRSRSLPVLILVVGTVGFLLLVSVARGGDVLTKHYNNARTGATLDEVVLNTTNVKPATFGKLWTLFADGQVVAEPLYVSSLAVDTTGVPNVPQVQGTFNAVIIATMHNTVYVYNADKENRGPDGRTIPLWARWLGPPRPGGKDIDMWSTNDPEWGILSTPVISPDKQTLYVVTWHKDNPGGFQYRLHALNLKNGSDRAPAVTVGVPSTDASRPCKGQSVFNPCTQKQRMALLLSNGVLYIGFGGDGNRGALFAFDAQTLSQRAFWSSTPTGENGGIWQSGQGPSADDQGNIYLIIGNGSFDGNNPGGKNFGSSFVRLKLEGQNLNVKDYFTPCNFNFLNGLDLDLGAAGPPLLPVNPPVTIGGGKEGILYVVSLANMGHLQATPNGPDCQNSNVVQQVKAFEIFQANNQTHYPNIHGSPVFWNGPDTARLYVWPENNPLKAFEFRQGKLQNVNDVKESGFRPPHGMPGGMLAVSANDNKAGSGIVWAVVPLNGDANTQRGVHGIVLALDAQDVSRTLWTSEQFADRDHLGLFAKFAAPVIANGKVFVATYGDDEPLRTYPSSDRHPAAPPQNYYVAVYGLLPTPPPQPMTINQNRDDVSVVRASTSPLNLDTAQCNRVDADTLDCTDALARTFNAPSFHRVLMPNNGGAAGCALLRVTTVSKNTGLANSTGIGFWSSQAAAGNQAAENSGLFIPKAKLKAIGTATLLNGAPATLHEFVGVSNCSAGEDDSVSRLFKPYMQFEVTADGKIFRNWDLATNYRISRNITQFDRARDVIQP